MAEPDELYPGGEFSRIQRYFQFERIDHFFFSFSRKDHIPEEYENADQNSCCRGQTHRREDMHGKSVDGQLFKNVPRERAPSRL